MKTVLGSIPIAMLAVTPFVTAPVHADDLADSSKRSGYSSIDDSVSAHEDDAYNAAVDDAVQACSNIGSSDAKSECEDAMNALR
jgi:hypothetical protein